MKLNASLVIDFDSTIIKEETLEMIAEEALEAHPYGNKIRHKIEEITDMGMRGFISFSDSLESRVKLFTANKNSINKIKTKIDKKISDSFLKNQSFFKENGEKIFIVSGGFKDCVVPVAKELSIPEENIFANDFVFNSAEEIISIDKEKFLAQDRGKVKQVEALNILGHCCVIGDGYTDYQIKEDGMANYFIAYTEHKKRPEVCRECDFEANNFNEVMDILNGLKFIEK
ncbi:MAG: HAD-IB family phosphatase [Candidatus Moraniibacteriota bacterium]